MTDTRETMRPAAGQRQPQGSAPRDQGRPDAAPEPEGPPAVSVAPGQATEFCRVLVREMSVADDWRYVQELIAAILRVRLLSSSGFPAAAVPDLSPPVPPPENEVDEPARNEHGDEENRAAGGRTVEEQVLADQRAAVSPPKHLLGSLAQEWRRCDRDKLPCSVLSIAMDNFGEFEARRGRAEAAACLRSVAGTVRGLCLRRRDRVFHRSNGTFVAVLPKTFPDGARCVADRIAHGVRGLGLVHPDLDAETPVVTVSVGIAGSVPSPEIKPADILRQADQILEAALRSGRGCVLPEFPRTVQRIDFRRFWGVLRPGVDGGRRRRTD